MNQKFHNNIKIINIVPGLKCTMSCDHCCNSSSPSESGKISFEKEEQIVKTINKLKPSTVYLTGGEPILYIELFNRILKKITYDCKVHITTNGSFATSLDNCAKVLDHFFKLDTIQLSFDRHHGSTLDSKLPIVLKKYAQINNINFNISVSLSDHKDIIFATKVEEKFHVEVIVGKIEGSGRARFKNVEFNYPHFDKKVLNMKCPNLDSISYIYGKGYTVCCSNLVYNNEDTSQFAFSELNELLRSTFYKEIISSTFFKLAEEKNIKLDNLSARFSSPCNL